MLKQFPIIQLSDPVFLSSCGRLTGVCVCVCVDVDLLSLLLYPSYPSHLSLAYSPPRDTLWYLLTALPPPLHLLQFVPLHFLPLTVLVLLNHFAWFRFFTTRHGFRFAEIVSFFLLCVWLVPFQYFISLSASENTIPSFGRCMCWLNPGPPPVPLLTCSPVSMEYAHAHANSHVNVVDIGRALNVDATSASSPSQERKAKFGSIIKTVLDGLIKKKDELLPTKKLTSPKAF